MNTAVKKYIIRINANDLTLDKIDLSKQNLTNPDIRPLIAAINANPEVARSITDIDLSFNNLTAPPILNLTKDVRMAWILLNRNPLTDAYKIALQALIDSRQAEIMICYDYSIPNNAPLTSNILDDHFRPLLTVSRNKILKYLNDIYAVLLLSYFPADIVKILGEMILEKPVEIRTALANIARFKDAFEEADRVNPREGIYKESIAILNAYKITGFTKQYRDALNAPELNAADKEAKNRRRLEH